jgi:hypothetical protein
MRERGSSRGVVCGVLLAATLAQAGELAGVKMPDSLVVESKTVLLNGQGLRTKFIFRVYVAGLYLEAKSSDASAILAADQVRRVDMHLLRDLDRKAICEAIEGGFKKNAAATLPALKDRLDKFVAVIPDLKAGQVLTLVYVPGQGTRVEGPGQSYRAEGKDFADALFAVWLGAAPVDEGLKKGMLGAGR